MPRKALRVDGGRGDDDLEVGTGRQQPLQVTEDEVDVQAAFVRLVDDQGVVAQQPPVPLHLGQQDPVGHHLDQGAVAGLVGEPHLVADGGADLGAEFGGDPLRHRAGRDPSGLGMSDLAGNAAAELQADLRQLRGLPRTGFARDDDHLVVADGRGDLVLALADRQVRRVGHHGHRGAGRGERGCHGGSLHGGHGETHDGHGIPRVPNTFPPRPLPHRGGPLPAAVSRSSADAASVSASRPMGRCRRRCPAR